MVRHRREDNAYLLAKMIFDRRKKSGLTQAQVAQRLKRPQSFVSEIENGKRGVDVIELIKIANAAGFLAHELLRDLELLIVDE